MKCIIIGGGKVGITLAEQLCQENHDVVIMDASAKRMQDIPESIDALRIVGNGASIQAQMEAGVNEADILIAVTGSDELNLLCCLIAKKAGKCNTIARVRNPVYSKEINFIKERLGVSMTINPELTTATEIARLLRFPSAIKIDTFAKGRVELLKFKIRPQFKLDQMAVSALQNTLKSNILVAAVEREDNVYIPNGDFVLKDGDLVSIIASPQNAASFFQTIPMEVEESAMIDGASVTTTFTKILIPLITPGIFTVSILTFINAWNNYLFAQVFNPLEKARTVTVALTLFQQEYYVPWHIVSAAAIIVTAPLIIVVLVLQKRIISGMMDGGVKG